MPTKEVDPLAELLLNTSSIFYQDRKPVVRELARCVDPSLPLLSFHNALGLDDSDGSDTYEDGGPKMSSKTTGLVASAAALGAIVLGIAAFFGHKYAMKKRAEARHSQHSGEDEGGIDRHSNTSSFGGLGPGAESPSRPPVMDRDRLNSDYYGAPSDYPVTERPFSNLLASMAPVSSSLNTSLPTAYRQSGSSQFAGSSPSALPTSRPAEPSGLNTVRSGSGSSVQSEMLGTRRRQSSMEIPIRPSWWKHASQWNDPSAPVHPDRDSEYIDPMPATGRVVTFDRPYTVSSSYSGTSLARTDGRRRSKGISNISSPYLQDNSLML
jgi:hypothetical protein